MLAILWASLCSTFLQTIRTGYATEGTLFISEQLSACSKKVWVLIRLWKQHIVEACTLREACLPRVENEFRLDLNKFGFTCAGVSNASWKLDSVWWYLKVSFAKISHTKPRLWQRAGFCTEWEAVNWQKIYYSGLWGETPRRKVLGSDWMTCSLTRLLSDNSLMFEAALKQRWSLL